MPRPARRPRCPAARRPRGPGAAGTRGPATGRPSDRPARPARARRDGSDVAPAPDAAPTRAVATSPAVGFFQPRPGLATGARVRAGDRLGTIDVLGVPHEVVAPTDGIVGATVVEPGEPVEYGQPVVEIELLDAPAGQRAEDA